MATTSPLEMHSSSLASSFASLFCSPVSALDWNTAAPRAKPVAKSEVVLSLHSSRFHEASPAHLRGGDAVSSGLSSTPPLDSQQPAILSPQAHVEEPTSSFSPLAQANMARSMTTFLPRLPAQAVSGESTVESFGETELDLLDPLYGSEDEEHERQSALDDERAWEEDEDDEEWDELTSDVEEALSGYRTQLGSPGLQAAMQVLDRAFGGFPEGEHEEEEQQKELVLEAVALALRRSGMEANLCETGWAQTSGLPAGQHKFIEILQEASSPRKTQGNSSLPGRVIIDLEFRSHFNIVKSTSSFGSLMKQVPEVFIGSEGVLLQLVELLVEGMRMSLQAHSLPVAPWRRRRYLESKWMAVAKRWAPCAESSTCSMSPAAGAASSFGSRSTSSSSSGDSLEAFSAATSSSSIPSSSGNEGLSSGTFRSLKDSALSWEAFPKPSWQQADSSADPALLSALAAKAARSSRSSMVMPNHHRSSATFEKFAHKHDAAPARVGMLHALLRKN